MDSQLGNLIVMRDRAKNGGFPSSRFQFLSVRAVHAGFEKVIPGLWNAGTESKHLGELTSCNPGGSDSPKLRTASARSGGTYFDRSWIVSSALPSASKREMAFWRIGSSISRERSSIRRAINIMAEAVTAVNIDNSRSFFSHSPAISAATTEC